MANKQVILVAAFDCNHSGIDFRKMVDARMQMLIKNRPKEQFVFTIFDVPAGTVHQSEVTDPKKPDSLKNRTATPVKIVEDGKEVAFKPCTRAHNYNEYTFKSDDPDNGVISITDIYSYVQRIGADPKTAGTLMELSYFCHGWEGGAVLVNSYENPPYDRSVDERDPTDKDTRPIKDFSPKTMPAPKLEQFKRAFHKDGYMWVWGCNFKEVYNVLLSHISKKTRSKTRVPKKLSDATMFEFEFVEDLKRVDAHGTPNGRVIFKDLVKIFNPPKINEIKKGKGPRWFKVKVSFGAFKKIFVDFMKASYVDSAAKLTGVTMYGALPGTFAEIEESVEASKRLDPKLPLMLITRNIPEHTDFTSNINFYVKHLNMKLDPEGRAYGKYTI